MHRCISAMLVASRDLKVWEDKFFVLIRSEKWEAREGMSNLGNSLSVFLNRSRNPRIWRRYLEHIKNLYCRHNKASFSPDILD